MRRLLAVALSVAGLLGSVGVAYADPPNHPGPNHNATNNDKNDNAADQVCDNVPHWAAAYHIFHC
jgi:hypothetical protein